MFKTYITGRNFCLFVYWTCTTDLKYCLIQISAYKSNRNVYSVQFFYNVYVKKSNQMSLRETWIAGFHTISSRRYNITKTGKLQTGKLYREPREPNYATHDGSLRRSATETSNFKPRKIKRYLGDNHSPHNSANSGFIWNHIGQWNFTANVPTLL